ncbi:MAG: FkbM family methyltransferase [Negativicutes bacterium]|nr:FkbM family methyltransferase [Negativicutes bacterium]
MRWAGCRRMFDPQPIAAAAGEIDFVYCWLADEQSRETLLGILRYRLSGDPHWLKVSAYRQYLHPEIINRPVATVVDGGAFNGDTAVHFYRAFAGLKRLAAFEPDRGNYRQLLENLTQLEMAGVTCRPVMAGLAGRTGDGAFVASGDAGSQFRDDGQQLAAMIRLDEFCRNEGWKVDYLKLDVEGMEREALDGGRQTIVSQRPALAVSVYHRTDDLWAIPVMIAREFPWYRLYLGHHRSFCWGETVVYAV